MKVFSIILGALLVIMSLVLLLITPAGLIGVLLGTFGIYYGMNYEKFKARAEEGKAELSRLKCSRSQSVKTTEKSPHIHVEWIFLRDINLPLLLKYKTGENDISRESLRDQMLLYDKGDKEYKDIYHITGKEIVVDGEDLYLDGEFFAHLLPASIEKYHDVMNNYDVRSVYIDAYYGHYAKFVHNPDYDPDEDDARYRFDIEYEDSDKPTATLKIDRVLGK